jgi:tetratricopeptide (TPR) repeat protein
MAGQPQEAEAAFRKAHELEPQAPDAWVALILYLAPKNPARATEELQAAQRALRGPGAAVALAPCWEALGKKQDAEAILTKALAAAPQDARLLSQCAGFYVRNGQSARAEALLRRLIDPAAAAPEGTVVRARRELAVLLTRAGGSQGFREALALLEENAKVSKTNLFDLRTKGLVLATHPAHRSEAIVLLKKGFFSDTASPPPGVRFLVARLHEAEGNWPVAAGQLRALVRDVPDNPVFLASFVSSLLRHKEPAEAREGLNQLLKIAGNSPEAVELEARVLKAEGKEEEALRRVKSYAAGGNARLDLAATLLEELGDPVEAERLWRRHAARPGHPEDALALARFLGRRGRPGEALDLCDKAWASCPVEAVARCCVGIATSAQASAEQVGAVERRLRALLDGSAQNPVFLLLLAELYEQTGRAQESIGLYRRVLEKAPSHWVALNNLAYLLALTGTPEEGLALVNTAIREHGPLPVFLDTRALVYLKSGQVKDALRDLDQAIPAEPTPTKYFHRAQACQMNNSRTEAAGAVAKGKEVGLSRSALHFMERTAYDELGGWLTPKSARSTGG